MADNQSSGLSVKNILLLILVAVTTSVVVTLLQVVLVGKSNVAITGGVVGALCVGMWMSVRKKSG